ncbi:methyl-accepting chemotaxis protein [Butyrivibrio sp. YAB3001]|uniref:methyl-accepting chemotaxis protein n=1 Tax=Butyrivibrio sp. YAB3001 TaxID=1520812 RepID=UPI0008F64C70|nr:methyl-accepting chemotaxis protein [Butyrivibrio sp. YAB3001]SFC88177.1 methyl-accepting chemotaxis protein [Butyrivibrio sp. YAB3001]
MKKKSRNMVRSIIVLASVLALIMAAFVGIIGYNHIKQAYYSSFQEGLHAAAVLMEDEIAHEWDGDWSLSEDGQLMKGETAIHDLYQSQLDKLHEKTGMHYTVFYGDTRYITSLVDAQTGKRMEGTKASDVVVEEVLKKGNEYLATNFEIAGQNWYAYYLPIKNSDGSVVGMIFAGQDTSIVAGNMNAAAKAIIGTFLFFFLFNWVIARIIITRSNKSISDIIGGLQKLEDGELSFYIEDRTFNRKDELGVIASSSAQVRDKLQDVISATKKLSDDVTQSGINLANSAESASRVAEQVTCAVEDISRGAASQAESMESSVNNTNEMGDSIDDITGRIEDLSAAANDMLSGAKRTVDTLSNLMDKNISVMNSMQDINTQIRHTNDSVKDIAEASSAITAIAEQTHLLSLNASIEAARAGEYGKGFSVVASEIGTLSNQSKEAAVSIKKIVETLVAESQKNVETIELLSENMKEQNTQLTSTKVDMDSVVENVNNVDSSTKLIAEKIHLLNELKTSFSDIISELSAISQQNAASTEETNASMEELNATFTLISDAANDLRDMAETLNEKMSYFTLDEMTA